MASYNRTLILADNSVAVRRGGAGEEGPVLGGRVARVSSYNSPEVGGSWEQHWAGGRGQLWAAREECWAPAHRLQVVWSLTLCNYPPSPTLACDSWMGLLQFFAYLIPGCQLT